MNNILSQQAAKEAKERNDQKLAAAKAEADRKKQKLENQNASMSASDRISIWGKLGHICDMHNCTEEERKRHMQDGADLYAWRAAKIDGEFGVFDPLFTRLGNQMRMRDIIGLSQRFHAERVKPQSQSTVAEK